MKPIFEKIPKLHEHSIFVKHFPRPILDMPYHYHPEFELTLTTNRSGKRFIGNSVEEIGKSDLVFIGKNLPHCFIGEGEVDDNSDLIVIQFHFEMFGEKFLDMPECSLLRELSHKAQRGISVPERSQEIIKRMMYEIIEADPLKQLIILLDILHSLSKQNNLKILCSKSFEKQYHVHDYHRLTEVYNFIIQNFKGEISLTEAARVANLSETAFCRYFKQRTTKTFKQVVNEMRISYACDLILKGRLSHMTVVQVSQEAGFRNLSNFNRQFKRITGMSPAQYSREFLASVI
ncbi:MAG: AraC family transcriptional regulator [Bacteroidota bacterium]